MDTVVGIIEGYAGRPGVHIDGNGLGSLIDSVESDGTVAVGVGGVVYEVLLVGVGGGGGILPSWGCTPAGGGGGINALCPSAATALV